jgi:dsRNA-specific ribonuclease
MRELSDEHSDMAVSLMQKLQLSISCKDFVMEHGFSAYDAIIPCLKHGYPFEKDVAWQCQLNALRDFLDSDEQTLDELETRRKALMKILDNSSGSDNLNCEIASKRSRTLLFCALFHDGDNENTSEENADNGVTETGSEEGMRHLLNFREMLHLVGAYSLQLRITTELHERYPKASEGDMHIMRACAINDDVVVYIMMKAGIQATVYRMDPKTINRFQLKMMVADGNGSEVWKACGGWVLNGGVEEYARRRCCGPSVPQYVGLAGGRLHGNKGKLPLDDTKELMFTMKAIMGALVLATGMDSMWQYIGPLFEELLLLSADELTREYSNHSTIFGKSCITEKANA